ncbi:ATP-binding cassette domain-containing protein [Pseudokineococcus sp. 1T1Z-3]|uniref:ATP-binding cassette domain-containing protein n=1 Tax=Pseudokineococcus sp. 1T1Z-3 TaxID=3132745 RepID=UPI0030B4EBD6
MNDAAGTPSLTLRDLSFSYGRRQVLDIPDLTWRAGPVGVLGVNGAGKTTLLRVLAGIATPSAGHLLLDGARLESRRDRSRYRERVGYLPQDPSWLPEFRVADFVRYFASLRLARGVDLDMAVWTALEAVDLQQQAHERLGELSGGQRQRAFIAQALVHDPDVVVLDEPTAGLDPVQRIRVRGLVAGLAESRLVVVSTHLVEDLHQLAREITVVDGGRALWHGTSECLAERGRASRSSGQHVSTLEAGFLDVLEAGAGTPRSA